MQEQILRLKTLQVKGKWLEWTSVMWPDLSWKSLLYGGPGKDLKILPASTLDVLPSPTNLRCWGNTVVDPYCSLCRAWACTTRHVLGACRVALDQGRCTWRQDNVLGVIVRNMREEIRFSAAANTVQTENSNELDFISFCKAGEKPVRVQPAANTVQTENSNELDFISFCKAGEKPVRVQPRQIWFPPDLLSAASDWKRLVDSVSAKISFPSCVARTTLTPDIVLYSTSRRIVFWMELTVCAEDRFSVSNSRKDRRYADLADQCRANECQFVSLSVEMGVRGFITDSFWRTLKALGFSNRRIEFISNLFTNKNLYTEPKQSPVSATCRRRRLLWFGHVVREGPESASYWSTGAIIQHKRHRKKPWPSAIAVDRYDSARPEGSGSLRGERSPSCRR